MLWFWEEKLERIWCSCFWVMPFSHFLICDQKTNKKGKAKCEKVDGGMMVWKMCLSRVGSLMFDGSHLLLRTSTSTSPS